MAIEYLPGEHKLHSAEPLTALYVPALHASQSLPSPVYPTTHWQCAASELPGGEKEFAGHATHWLLSALEYESRGHIKHACADVEPVVDTCLPGSHWVHCAEPLVGLNLPATHASHGPPPGPVKPILHEH